LKNHNLKKLILVSIFILLNTLFAQPAQQIANIGDLKLESGEIILNCHIGYQIIGKANKDSSNIIVYPTWFGGLSKDIAGIIGKYNLIDTTKYMVIAIDALGNGISSSPSNYDKKFPLFTIRDMVKSQFHLINKILKIKHLYAIIGGSMGSFQTFEWLVCYPDFIDKAIPYVCSPVRTSSDKLRLNLEKDIISLHKNYDIPEAKTQRIMNMLTAYFSKTQNYLSKEIDTYEFDEYYQKFEAKETRPFSMENRLSQINAMLTHDISQKYNNSLEFAAKKIKAEMLIIVSDSDQVVNPQPAIELSKMTNSELIVLSNDCGHLAPGCNMKKFGEHIAKFLK